MSSQLWGAVVIIVLGYVLGFYFQSRSIAHLGKRIDDLRAEINHRFDDLKDWIRSEVKRLEERIQHVEHAIVRG
jgi:Tfp pilus assembly protein PilN